MKQTVQWRPAINHQARRVPSCVLNVVLQGLGQQFLMPDPALPMPLPDVVLASAPSIVNI